MVVKKRKDKKLAQDILFQTLKDNPSVITAVKNDRFKDQRIKLLIKYLGNLGYRNKGLHLSSCGTAAAVAMVYHNVKKNLASILDMLVFAFFGGGISKIAPTLRKEAYLDSVRPKDKRFVYLWIIGVKEGSRNGSSFKELMKEIYHLCKRENLDLYYETSVLKNVKAYKILGGKVYHSFSLGEGKPDLYCFCNSKKDLGKRLGF